MHVTSSSFPSDLLSIGAFSRASGLSVSALRFYDAQHVFSPAVVDPHSGYRRYAVGQVRAGRLIAGMRRIRLPLHEIAVALEGMDEDPATAIELLEVHLARLEDDLELARRDVRRLSATLRPAPQDRARAVIRVQFCWLHEALASVRYAAATDPAIPVLGCVLLEATPDAVWVVATDRYRLASVHRSRDRSTTEPEVEQRPARIVLPMPVVDALIDHRAAPGATAEITAPRIDDGEPGLRASHPGSVLADRIEVCVDGTSLIQAPATLDDYPDVLRLVEDRPVAPELSVTELRDILRDHGEDSDAVQLTTRGEVLDGSAPAEGATRVSRELLWDALSAIDDGHLTLPLSGQIGPLYLSDRSRAHHALVMPIAPEPHEPEAGTAP